MRARAAREALRFDAAEMFERGLDVGVIARELGDAQVGELLEARGRVSFRW